MCLVLFRGKVMFLHHQVFDIHTCPVPPGFDGPASPPVSTGRKVKTSRRLTGPPVGSRVTRS